MQTLSVLIQTVSAADSLYRLKTEPVAVLHLSYKDKDFIHSDALRRGCRRGSTIEEEGKNNPFTVFSKDDLPV